MLQSSELTAIAAILPLVGLFLSWVSFRWAEVGASPENFQTPSNLFGFIDDQLRAGERRRARLCARVFFNAGALLVAAAAPMGNAASHVHDSVNLIAISAYAILLFTLFYAVLASVRVMRDRKHDAFSLYFTKDMHFLYNREETKKSYFELNPMPLWSVFDRKWFAKLKVPNIDDIVACASIKKAPVGLEVS